MRIRSVFLLLSLLACASVARAKPPQSSGTTRYYHANGTSAGSSRTSGGTTRFYHANGTSAGSSRSR